jgi:hypothetical protein
MTVVWQVDILTLFLTAAASSAIFMDILARRGAREASQQWGKERSRRRFRKPVIAGGRSWLDPGPLKQTVRDEQFGSHLPHHTSSRAAQRATLDTPTGSQLTLRAPRCWLFDTLTTSVIPDGA